MNVRELVTKIGFKIDKNQLAAAEKSIHGIKTSLEVIAGAGVAAAGTLFEFAKSAAETGEQLELTSAKTGLNIKQLQEFQGAAKLAGMDTENFNMAMRRFSRNVGMAGQGISASAQAFRMYGINVRDSSGALKPNSELIKEVADKMASIKDPAEQAALAFKMFGIGGSAAVNFFKEGSKGIDENIKKVDEFSYIYGDKAVKASVEFEKNLKLSEMAVTGLKNEIGVALLPQINKVILSFMGWFQANRAVLSQRMDSFFKGLSSFVGVLWSLMKGFIGTLHVLVDAFGGVQRFASLAAAAIYLIVASRILSGFWMLATHLRSLVILFKELAAGAALSDVAIAAIPIAIAAIGTILALVINDIYNFEKGNKSVTGMLIQDWNNWITTLEKSHPVLNAIAKTVGAIGHAMGMTGRAIGVAAGDIATRGTGKTPSFHDQLQFIKTGNMATPSLPVVRPMQAGAAKGITNNVHVTVNAPPGTAQDHVQYVKSATEEIINNHLRGLTMSYPAVQ